MTDSTDNSESKNPDESGWVPCCQGEISGMVSRLARQRRLAAAGKVSSVVVVLLLAFGLWQYSQADNQHQAAGPEESFNFGSICCSDVMQYASAFQKGELDEELTAQIGQHVAECPHCGPKFKRMAEEPQASLSPPARFSPVVADSVSSLGMLAVGN